VASKEHLGVVNKELKELGEHQVRLVLQVNKVLRALGELEYLEQQE
jgi:hypothetical protein